MVTSCEFVVWDTTTSSDAYSYSNDGEVIKAQLVIVFFSHKENFEYYTDRYNMSLIVFEVILMTG